MSDRPPSNKSSAARPHEAHKSITHVCSPEAGRTWHVALERAKSSNRACCVLMSKLQARARPAFKIEFACYEPVWWILVSCRLRGHMWGCRLRCCIRNGNISTTTSSGWSAGLPPGRPPRRWSWMRLRPPEGRNRIHISGGLPGGSPADHPDEVVMDIFPLRIACKFIRILVPQGTLDLRTRLGRPPLQENPGKSHWRLEVC